MMSSCSHVAWPSLCRCIINKDIENPVPAATTTTTNINHHHHSVSKRGGMPYRQVGIIGESCDVWSKNFIKNRRKGVGDVGLVEKNNTWNYTLDVLEIRSDWDKGGIWICRDEDAKVGNARPHASRKDQGEDLWRTRCKLLWERRMQRL